MEVESHESPANV